MSVFGDIAEWMGLPNMTSKYQKQLRAAERTRRFNAEEAEKQRQFARQQQLQQQEFNSGQAVINREFQTNMANTAVQRRMTDLKQAGVNPMLAGNLVGGSPAGNMATSGVASGSSASSGQEQVADNPIYGVLKSAISGMTAVATARIRKS